jgi:hypothetical protein
MRKARWMTQVSIPTLALAAVPVPGCSGGTNPSGSSAAPDIRGTYAGNVAWMTNLTSSPGGPSPMSETRGYSGHITIDHQTGSAFSGTLSIEGTASGTLTRGTVNADGTVSFELPDPEGGPHPPTDTWSESCSLAFDSVVYEGRADGAAFEAARSQRYSCPKAGVVSVSVTFNGRK